MNNNTTVLATTTAATTILSAFQQKQCILHMKEKIQLVLYILVIIFGVLGNASICHFFGLFSKTARKGVSEVLILYLACTDFCASVFSPFIVIYWIVTCRQEWHFGVLGCKLLPFLGRVFINMSVGIIVILALDRYRAICSPFEGQFKKKYIHISVLLTALLSILCEIYYLDALTLYVKPLALGSKGCLVTPDDNEVYIKVTSSILITRDLFFVLMFTFTSVRIIINLRKRNIYMTSPNPSSSSDMERVIRVIIVMQIVFIVLVLPRDLLHIIFQISWLDGDGIAYNKHITSLNAFLKVFQTANCCANVFIYAKMHDRFRKKIIEIMRLSVGCAVHSLSESDTIQTVLDANGRLLQSNQSYTRQLLRESNRYEEVTKIVPNRTCDSSLVKWRSDGSLYDNYFWEKEH